MSRAHLPVPAMSHRISVFSFVTLLTLPCLPLQAQVGGGHAAAFNAGVIAGAMRYAGGRTEQALGVVLQYVPQPWLTFSTSPGFGHTSLGNSSAVGPTDIPLSV